MFESHWQNGYVSGCNPEDLGSIPR